MPIEKWIVSGVFSVFLSCKVFLSIFAENGNTSLWERFTMKQTISKFPNFPIAKFRSWASLSKFCEP